MFIVAVGIMFMISILVGFKLNNALNDQLQNISDFPDEAKDASRVVNERFGTIFDFAFVVLFIGLYLVTLISAWFLDSSPIFFIISLVLTILILIAIALLTNVTQGIVGNGAFVGILDRLPIIYFFATNLFKISVVMAGGILIALYAKNKSGEVAG